MRTCIYLMALTIFSIFIASSVNAADVKIYKYHNKNAHFIGLEGPIEPGDLNKLQRAYNDARINKNSVHLWLNSPGGRGSEMKKIVEWMKNKRILTMVGKDHGCYSACAVIWTFGKTRYMDKGASIGYHVSSMAMIPESIKWLDDIKGGYGWIGIQGVIQDNYAEDLQYYYTFPVKNKGEFVAQIGMNSINGGFWMLTAGNHGIIGNVRYGQRPTPVESVKPTPQTSKNGKVSYNSATGNLYVTGMPQNGRVYVTVRNKTGQKIQFRRWNTHNSYFYSQFIFVKNGLLDLEVIPYQRNNVGSVEVTVDGQTTTYYVK